MSYKFLIVDSAGHSYLTDGKTGRFYRVTIDHRPTNPERVKEVYELVSDKEPAPEQYVMTPEFANYQKILMRDNLL